jgi:hypothetical protein
VPPRLAAAAKPVMSGSDADRIRSGIREITRLHPGPFIQRSRPSATCTSGSAASPPATRHCQAPNAAAARGDLTRHRPSPRPFDRSVIRAVAAGLTFASKTSSSPGTQLRTTVSSLITAGQVPIECRTRVPGAG